MTCYKPIQGYLTTDAQGNKKFKADKDYSNAQNEQMQVPCGRCYGCRLEQARNWAVRLVHEAQGYPEEQRHFLTLTYAPEHLPKSGSLKKKHFQDFMKRLREHIAPAKIRFFHCGEYGTVCLNCGKSKPVHDREGTCSQFSPTIGRPHYHAIIFGLDLQENHPKEERRLEFFKITQPAQEKLYTNKLIEEKWGKGFCTIGKVTYESCSYVARYIMKKITGDPAEGHYMKPLHIDQDTGEILDGLWLTPEYITMSRRPGIGYDHAKKYLSDIYPYDRVVQLRNGKSYVSRPPKYYDKILEDEDKAMYKQIKKKRKQEAQGNIDNQEERLRAREMVKRAQTKNLNRHFEDYHNDY